MFEASQSKATGLRYSDLIDGSFWSVEDPSSAVSDASAGSDFSFSFSASAFASNSFAFNSCFFFALLFWNQFYSERKRVLVKGFRWVERQRIAA